MAGLSDSTDGLEYGTGLSFMRGLSGSPGLINPAYSGAVDLASASFAGSGGLRVSATLRQSVRATFSGSGSLSVHSP